MTALAVKIVSDVNKCFVMEKLPRAPELNLIRHSSICGSGSDNQQPLYVW